ncbi:MAG: acyltransferase family protein [Limisphaerales bacterium]
MCESPSPPGIVPPAVPPREERLHALDNLRAVAMLLGIVLHAALSFMTLPIPWIARDVGRNFGFDILVGVIHGFRMQLFFFIAGFFGHLLWQRLGPKEFLRQRGKRIGIPFLVGMVTLVPLIILLWGWSEMQTTPRPTRPQYGALTVFSIPTGHLWFLEMLLLLYGGAVLIAWAGLKAKLTSWLPRLDAVFDWFIGSFWKPLLLVPPTVGCLWGGPVLGEIDAAGLRLLPAARAVAYYSLFFLLGWWLHRRRHHLDALRGWLKTYFGLAVVAFLTLGACHLMMMDPSAVDATSVKLLALVAASLYAWTMTFAVTGWFLRFAGQHSAWVRYVADASYWCYLLHLPLVLWLQVIVSHWPLNGWLKFAFILAVNVVLLLLSYHWCVRYTWIGRLLNGPREKPKASAS